MVTGEVVLLTLITLINLALWFVFFFKLKKSFSPHALLSDIKNEVEKLIIEINKTTLEDVSLIEERTAGLKSLIEEVDQRLLLQQGFEKGKKRELEVLNVLSEKSRTVSTNQNAVQKYNKMSKKVAEESHEDSVQLSIDFDSYRLADEVDNAPQNMDTTLEIPAISNTNGSLVHEISLNEKIMQFAENGFSPEEIAKKLGCSLTVVQLVIDLH